MLTVIVALTLFASLLVADTQAGAAASDTTESVRVERVLTGGQIDSSTVDVGAFVVVIYGQGERQPVSGVWTQLDTARGYLKAIDPRRLIVGLEPDGWSKWIALERIQTLSFINVPLSAAVGDSASTTEEINHRLIRSVFMGDSSRSTPSDSSAVERGRVPWTGRIEQHTIWRDTVYVGGDVTIAAGATLTLAPNTQVRFMPYRDDTQGGLDSTRAELIVEGRLNAQAGGIVVGSADTGSLGADWYGIVVERGGLADISNATIRDGLRCLDAETGGRVTMDHVAFVNCRGDNVFGRFAVGVFGGAMIGMIMGSAGESGCGEMGDDPFCGTGTFVGGVLGMVAGAIIIGLGLAYDSPDQAETPSTSDEARRVSVDLLPNPKGGLSAIATLHF